ncbi:MAG: TVP38/TMEM64 family protein [Trueperaceae bacterium]
MKLRHWLVIAVWLGFFIAFWVYVQGSGRGVTEILTDWLGSLSRSPYSVLFLLGIYLVRPLLLLPITVLTVFSGFLYGALWGTVYATLATLASSGLAYLIGRFLSGDNVRLQTEWLDKLRERSFETVLTSRLIFLPGDLVNYACGFLKISFTAFLLATALGGLPGLLVGVLAGASLETFSADGFKLNPWYIVASFVLLVGSLLVSRLLRNREMQNKEKAGQKKYALSDADKHEYTPIYAIRQVYARFLRGKR